MQRKILPEPHHYAVCAFDDIPIKEFYKKYYNDIYICLHPFLLLRNTDDNILFSSPENYPNKNSIILKCKKIFWNDIIKYTGLDTWDEIDIALRTMIGGLNSRFAREDLAKTLMKKIEENNIVPPDAGRMSDILYNDLLNSLKDIGHQWLWVGDEFCTERKLFFIDDLIENNEMLSFDNKIMFTYNHEILFATHWDSFFTLICGEKNYIDKSISKYHLEGFYCNEETKIYWSCQNK
jgi:hypothetical protein